MRALRAPLQSEPSASAVAHVVPASALRQDSTNEIDRSVPIERTSVAAPPPEPPRATNDDLPWRLIVLGAAGLVAVVLVFGGQFMQSRP